MSNEVAKMDNLPVRKGVRKNIQTLHDAIKHGIKEEQLVEFDVNGECLTHRFIEGVYAREMVIPAGHVVIGKLHRQERICIISGGECMFLTEFGKRHIKAPYTEIIPPGSETAVYAITDTTWTAIVRVEHRNVDRIEKEILAPDHASYEWLAKKDLGS